MIFGTCKLHITTSGVMQILCKFCHNKHFNTLDGATYDQHDCRRQTTWKKIICCTPANSSSVITSATNNSPRIQMFAAQFPEDSCEWCVLLTANQLLDTRDICCSPYWPATPTTNDSVNISTYRQHQYQHRLFWWVGQGLICTKLCWQIPSESGESSSSFPPVTPL